MPTGQVAARFGNFAGTDNDCAIAGDTRGYTMEAPTRKIAQRHELATCLTLSNEHGRQQKRPCELRCLHAVPLARRETGPRSVSLRAGPFLLRHDHYALIVKTAHDSCRTR